MRKRARVAAIGRRVDARHVAQRQRGRADLDGGAQEQFGGVLPGRGASATTTQRRYEHELLTGSPSVAGC